MTTILEYKVRIKEWEKGFAAKHGKPPSKSDVKADPEIRKAYKVYNELKKAEKPKEVLQRTQGKRENAKDELGKLKDFQSRQEVPKSLRHVVDVYLTDDEDEKPVAVRHAELGPTPQANGKVLSLFDLMSPPESSPIKKDALSAPDAKDVFKTPTRSVKRIEAADITPSRSSGSLMERLRTAASPSNPPEDTMATPFYLGKVTSKFSFSENQTSQESPSKLLRTPEKPLSLEDFQVSPSPLKSQRYLSFGGTKKVSQIFQEFQSLAAAQDFEEQKREIEEETLQVEKLINDEAQRAQLEEAPGLARKRKKALTQKRTTRRWKIKPRLMEDDQTFEGKDVHEEIDRLDKATQADLEKYIKGEDSGGEFTDDDNDNSDDAEHENKPILRNPNLSTKINPISNNYQRLKINDPRTKMFKKRMGRR